VTYWEFLPFVKTRDDFIRFVGLLSVDADRHADEWTSATIGGLLDSLAVWLADTRGRSEWSDPSWKVFAEMLAAARVYE